MPSSPESDTERPAERASLWPRQQPDNGELTAELARIEDRYKRALADLDNYRKRAAREVESRVCARSGESVIRDWLDAVDSVERAMRMQPDGPCADGLRAVLEQMDGVLARQGVERIGAAGDRVRSRAPRGDRGAALGRRCPDRTILAVERSGFALGDRVIRPAQVVVARAPEHAR